MKHVIENGPVFTTVRITLDEGEVLKAEPGSMVTMDTKMDLKVKKTNKSFFKSIGAMFGGESFFASYYTAEGGPQEIVLAPGAPGDILHFKLDGQTLYAQPGAWMAGNPDMNVSTKGSLKGMVSGEGLFLQKITGTGDVFLATFGAVIEKSLAADEEYVVDTGAMVAYEESVTYKITKAAKGLLSSFMSGEGLVCRFKGPGKVWIQTRNLGPLAKLIQPYMSTR
jgi:uncharacterized protein (TIGR00266 family)